MFKVSKFNPKDKTLDEIHAVQRKVYQEDKGFAWPEIVKKYRRVREELSKQYNLNFKVILPKESFR